MNYNKYQTAANVGIEAKKSLLTGASDAQTKAGEVKEFAFDKAVDFDEKQTTASKKYGDWKTALGVGAGILGFGLGLGPLAMAAMAGGGTFLGGKLGEHSAAGTLKGFDWFKGGQKDLKEAMKTQTYASAISSAVMGGIGASTAQGAAAEAGKVAGAEAGKGYVNLATKEAVNKMHYSEFGKQFLQNLKTTGTSAIQRGADKAFGPKTTLLEGFQKSLGIIDGFSLEKPVDDPSVIEFVDDIDMKGLG